MRLENKSHAKTQTTRPRIYTVGHSNRSLDEFIELLTAQKLKLLIDVRKIPKSRHNPHFWGTRLEKSLRKHGIEYRYFPGLGGRRRSQKHSVNMGWRSVSFRGYADHMQTDEFQESLKKLISAAKRKRLAIMCAEAVPWRCHRSLIADALIARGYEVADIFSKTSVKPHKLTSFAKVKNGLVTYPE